MSNDRIDLSREALNNEGNIWLNRNTKQIRTSLGESEPNSWYNPVSVYEVGSESKLRRGQPVSVGYLDQLYPDSKLSGDSCIVPTNPSINQWCIGLALEPGFHREGNEVKKIHVQSTGQIEYKLSTKDDDDYYLPPHSETKFEWTYDDIGKPVFVSNKNPGELTLDIAEAAFNGGTIVSVGRIADAPLADEKNISLQKIVLEVQLSGDVRGVVDTSQIQVEIASKSKHASLGIQVENLDSNLDRVFFFFIKDGYAYFILDDEIINKYSQNSPVGALVINSKDGVLNLESLLGKKTLIYRLGLLKGNFGFSKIGNTAYLSNGFIDESSASSSYDYKIGVILSKDSVLIDCRYPRFVAKKTMIGDIKPLFENGLCEPGYAKVDDKVHKVIFDKNDPVCSDGIDWKDLVEGVYTKDLFVFSRSKDGPFTTILEGGWTPDGAGEDSTGFLNKFTYFKFRDLIYTIGENTCGCQIKFSKDDSSEAMNYIWPEQTFELSLVPDPGREDDENYVLGGNLSSSKLKLDISKLTALGQYMDSNGQNIEAYDIFVREKETNQLISSGFYQIEDNGKMKWCGYEWKVSRDSYTNQTFLTMITVPGEEPNSKCLGFCWPIGQKLTSKVDLYVTVRRRPTQYHELYLNQVNQNNPWAPHTDGNNLITGDSIYFGAKLKETPADSNIGQNSGYNKENIGTGEIHFSSSNNEGSINTIITEPDSEENKIKIFYDIKSIATRSNNDKIRRYIKWGYDFEDNVTTLSSAFAPSLVQPSTRNKFIHGFDGNVQTIASDFKNEDALPILHEFQPKILNYSDDDPETRQNWKKISFIFDDILKAKTNSNEYSLYDTDDTEIDSMKYSISSQLRSSLEKTVGYLYGNSNGYLSYISNIGLLNAAAKNTQDRLLKIERALFGSDFYSNPQGQASKKNENYLDIDKTISNSGILRDIDSLRRLGVIDDRRVPDRILDQENGLSSIIKEFYATNYMDYNSYKMFNENKNSFDVKASFGETENTNHLLDLWIDYCNSNRINYQLSFKNSFISKKRTYPIYDYDSLQFLYTKEFFRKIDSSISADRIYLKKYMQKYNNEKKEINTTAVDYNSNYSVWKGSMLKWPINADSDFKDFDLYDNFFNSIYAGVDDYVDDQTDSTFSAQSLEGLVLDLYSKLSFIKSRFDYDGNLNASIFKKFYNFKSISEFKVDSREHEYADGIYSAFSISNNRFENFYRIDLVPTHITLHFGNDYFFNEKTIDDFDKYSTLISRWSSKRKDLDVQGYGNVSLLHKPLQYFVFLRLFEIAAGCAKDIYKQQQTGSSSGYITGHPELINKFISACKAILGDYFSLNFETLIYKFLGYNLVNAKDNEGNVLLDAHGNVIKVKDWGYWMNWHTDQFGNTIKNNSTNQKEFLMFYVNNFINNKQYKYVDSITLEKIFNTESKDIESICKSLFPSYHDASLEFLSIYGETQYEYERHNVIYDTLIKNVFEIYSSNPDKNGIFVDYNNTKDSDQITLTHSSNNINLYLKSHIDETKNSLIPYTLLSKVDETKDDITLERRYREILQTKDFSDDEVVTDRKVYAAPLISSKMPRNDYYDEEYIKFNGFDLDKNGSLKVTISSLKEALNGYNNDVFDSLKTYNESLALILQEYNNHLISSINEYNEKLLSKLEGSFDELEISGSTATKKTTITHKEKELTVKSITANKIQLEPINVSIDVSSDHRKSDFKVSASVEGGTYSYKIDEETIEASIESETLNIYGVNEDGSIDRNTIIGKVEIPAKQISITIPEKTIEISIPEKTVSCDLTDNLDSILQSFVEDLHSSTDSTAVSLPDISKIEFDSFTEDFPSLIVPSKISESDYDASSTSTNENIEELNGLLTESTFDVEDIKSSNPIKNFKIKEDSDEEIEDENSQTSEYKINNFIVRDDPIKDFDLENPRIEDLSLDVSINTETESLNETGDTEEIGTESNAGDENISNDESEENNNVDKSLTIERKGDLYPYGYIEQVQKLFVDRAFNNRSIVKNVNKITSKEEQLSNGSYKDYYVTKDGIYDSIRDLPLNDFETSTTNWTPTQNVIEDFVDGRTDRIYVNRDSLKTLISYVCEDPTIINIKIDFIFNKCGIISILVKNLSTLYEDISKAYDKVKESYDSRVQQIIESKELLDKPLLKEGFYLYGKQQKRPDIMFTIDGDRVLDTFEKKLVDANEDFVPTSSKQVAPWSNVQYSSIEDIYHRTIHFKINDKDYSINKFILVKVDNFTDDQYLSIISRFVNENCEYGFNKALITISNNFIIIPILQYDYLKDAQDTPQFEYVSFDTIEGIKNTLYTSVNKEDFMTRNQRVDEDYPNTPIVYVPDNNTLRIDDVSESHFDDNSMLIDFEQKNDFLLQNSYLMKSVGIRYLVGKFEPEIKTLGEVENYKNSVYGVKLSDIANSVNIY